MKPKRKFKNSDTFPELILEEVIGLTTKDANGLASNSSSSKFVYMAGCVVVVYNVDAGTRSYLVVSHRMPKPLSCVAVSRNGRFVAAGESGYQPAILGWDLETLASVSELKGHQHGVACMDFSPDGKYLVSVGFSHDGFFCLWEWRSGMLAAKVKASSSFSAVASVKFSADGKFIVTAGKSHLKFWKLSTSSRSNARTGSLVVHGKPINLGHYRGCSFIALSSSISNNSSLVNYNQNAEFSPIHALTDTGILSLLDSKFKITNSVDLKVKKGFALSASDKVVACACNNGMVKLFGIYSLKYTGSLLHAEVKMCNKGIVSDCDAKANESRDPPLPTFPDAIACQFSALNKLVVVYGDHSLYIWDIDDESKGSKSCVLVSHSACIWDVKNLSCEYMHHPSLACVARGCPGGVSFATCSADGTIRLWDLVLQPELSESCSSMSNDCSLAITSSVGTARLVSAGIFERDPVMSSFSIKGFRAMAVSSDGKHLAAGDCEGNLHLYNLHTSDYIYIQDAHDAEILSLTFSLPIEKDNSSEKDLKGYYLLASGGRDRIVHLYDVDRNFDLIGSVDDHPAAVTSVKVNANGSKLLSCADRCLVFHDVAATDNGYTVFRCHNQAASHETIHDMAVDPMMEHVVTVTKDKKVNTFNIASAERIASFKQDGDFGEPRKINLDPSSSYLVCTYSNKSICLHDFLTGQLVARAVGHGEAITGVAFLPDCKHLVSVDANGCIFVWKLPAFISSKIVRRVQELYCQLSPIIKDPPIALSQIKLLEADDSLYKINPIGEAVPQNFRLNQVSQRVYCEGSNPEESPVFKFSISRLPKWAQDKVTGPDLILSRSDHPHLQQVGMQALSSSVTAEERTAMRYELQTPSKDNVGCNKKICGTMTESSPDTDNSQATPFEEASRSFTLDRRWFTIHTVCLDLLNSPEVWDMKKMQAPQPYTNFSAHKTVENSTDTRFIKLLSGGGDCGVDNSSRGPTLTITDDANKKGTISNGNSGLNSSSNMCNSINQLDIRDAVACSREDPRKGSEDTRLYSMDGKGDVESQENNTPYLNFDDLSENFKGRKSSSRRRYSAQFVVRCDLVRGQQKQFRTPMRSIGSTASNINDTGPSIVTEEQSVQIYEESESQRMKTTQQKNLANMGMQKDCWQEKSTSGTSEKGNTITSCKEALIKLDSATENALQLFSKLDSLVSGENTLTGPGAELYVEAAEMLPSIAKRVHTIAKLMQSMQNNSCKEAEVDVNNFKPFLGTFAENISQRVVEILKKNPATL